MKYKISEQRSSLLREMFFEHTFKEPELNTEVLNSISEPIELDFIARNHNYDDGNEILINIINNPNCDLSTVKMIFFRADVDGFIENPTSTEDYELIENIVKNCNNGIYKSEKFYYDHNQDINALYKDIGTTKHLFPQQLFEKPKGRKIESNFAEKFKQRNLARIPGINIVKTQSEISLTSQNSNFKYTFPEQFGLLSNETIEQFIEHYKFPSYLKSQYFISDKQLKNSIFCPEIVLRNEDTLIIFYIFNSKPLKHEKTLINVATIMKHEFSNIQAFIKIISVEEEFDKIKKVKWIDNWIAISRGMQIKIENSNSSEYSKLLLLDKDNILYYFTIISKSIENLENEILQEIIIKHIEIQ